MSKGDARGGLSAALGGAFLGGWNRETKREFLRRYGFLMSFLFVSVIISAVTPDFLSERNILNMLRQSSIVGIMAIGTTFVIIGGGFDISVGSVLALSAALCIGLQENSHMHWALAMCIALGMGAAVGFVNGFLAAKVYIVPIIVTLGMQYIVRGLVYLYTQGMPLSYSDPQFSFIASGYLWGFPIPVIIFIAMILFWQFVLSKTQLGRYSCAIGGNKEAARLSGVGVDFYHIMTFVIGGLMAAMSGVLLASRLSSATPLAGDGYDLQAIAATVIGGTSVSGGEGSVVGTFAGVLLMAVISNAFNLLGVQVYGQKLITGAIILIVVGIDSYSKKKPR
jgi:ribose transport system permease protein